MLNIQKDKDNMTKNSNWTEILLIKFARTCCRIRRQWKHYSLALKSVFRRLELILYICCLIHYFI